MNIFGKNIFGVKDITEYIYTGIININSDIKSGKIDISIAKKTSLINLTKTNDESFGTLNMEE